MSEKKYIGLEDLEEINKQYEQMKKDKKKNKKERKSIFEKFSTKENIIIFSFLLIFLIIISVLIKKYDPFRKIDYKNITISHLLMESVVSYDRDTYWILNDILLSFLYSGTTNTISANGEGSESNLYYKFSTEEYYDALTDDYQKFLSEEKYLELANKLISNFKENYEVLISATNIAPIRKVYKCNQYSGDLYLVKLNTSTNSYIGIELFKDVAKYRIFYME